MQERVRARLHVLGPIFRRPGPVFLAAGWLGAEELDHVRRMLLQPETKSAVLAFLDHYEIGELRGEVEYDPPPIDTD